jgi:hypothetical protein
MTAPRRAGKRRPIHESSLFETDRSLNLHNAYYVSGNPTGSLPAEKHSLAEICTMLGISKPTLYAYVGDTQRSGLADNETAV